MTLVVATAPVVTVVATRVNIDVHEATYYPPEILSHAGSGNSMVGSIAESPANDPSTVTPPPPAGTESKHETMAGESKNLC